MKKLLFVALFASALCACGSEPTRCTRTTSTGVCVVLNGGVTEPIRLEAQLEWFASEYGEDLTGLQIYYFEYTDQTSSGHYSPGDEAISLVVINNNNDAAEVVLLHELVHLFAHRNGYGAGHPDEVFGEGGLLSEAWIVWAQYRLTLP